MGSEAYKPGNHAMNGLRTSPSLLLRVRNRGDQKSWGEFVEVYAPLILRYLRRIGVPEQEAADLQQDVMCLIVRHIHKFDYDPGRSFRAWVKTIAKNRAFRFFAQKGRLPLTPGGSTHNMAVQQVPCDDREQEELIEEEWRRRRLELAVAKVRPQVTPQTWRVFELRFIEKMPSGEVAERLGMSVGSVYTSLSRFCKGFKKPWRKSMSSHTNDPKNACPAADVLQRVAKGLAAPARRGCRRRALEHLCRMPPAIRRIAGRVGFAGRHRRHLRRRSRGGHRGHPRRGHLGVRSGRTARRPRMLP